MNDDSMKYLDDKIKKPSYYEKFSWKIQKIRSFFLYKLHLFFIKICIPLCHYPDCFKFGKLRRQNTAYNDDELNWAFLCPSCQEEANEYWQERWNEYYSMTS